jgi:hypothetical protein
MSGLSRFLCLLVYWSQCPETDPFRSPEAVARFAYRGSQPERKLVAPLPLTALNPNS